MNWAVFAGVYGAGMLFTAFLFESGARRRRHLALPVPGGQVAQMVVMSIVWPYFWACYLLFARKETP